MPLLLLTATLVTAQPANAADPCPPCQAFDRFDKQIRDGELPRAEAQRQFTARITELDAFLAGSTSATDTAPWIFPLRDYDLAASGPEAAKSYVAAGYDYFDGNRHGGHPSFDLFIHDRNQDSLDDRTGKPVTVVSITGGIVVAVEPEWETRSPLRGGRYLWIYDPVGKRLLYYAHNFELLVGVGDRVAPGTPLATVGRTGLNAAKHRSPTHLHLTVLKVVDSRPVPENVLPQLRAARKLPVK